MTKVVFTAQVTDAVKWEEGYRAHAPVLRSILGITKPVHFSTNEETNEICIYGEPDDLEKYLELVGSPEVVEAMEKNGVIKETAKIHILDKVIQG
jgi:hypothetical protein